MFTFLLLSLNDVMLLTYFAAILLLQVIKKCKSVLNISKFLGNATVSFNEAHH